MYIYFVRHGETAHNRRNIHQSPGISLSEQGASQIRKTAEALKEIPITKLFASNYTRAKQSAEIMSKTLGLPVEERTLFRELVRPSVLYGKPLISMDTVRVGLRVLFHARNHDWHHSDEENFHDIRNRLTEIVAYLKEIGEAHDHVVVVTHAVLIRLLMKRLCKGRDITFFEYLTAPIIGEFSSNAAITTVVYNDDGNRDTPEWICEQYDDRSHLL